MAEIPCVSVVIMQSMTVKTRAENSELLLKNFTIPGKSVAMPADSDRPLQAAIVHPADDLKVSFDPGLVAHVAFLALVDGEQENGRPGRGFVEDKGRVSLVDELCEQRA